MFPLAQLSPNTREVIDNLARTPLSQVVTFVVILTVVRLAIAPYLLRTAPHRRTGLYGGAKFVNEIMDAFVYAGVFVFLLIRPFGLQAFTIPSGSMWPTLYVNDFIVANKAVYRYSDPKAGEIVVFRPPLSATQDRPGQVDPITKEVKVDFIKRCIGTPGQVIELRQGVLYRDGQKADELYKAYSQCTTPHAQDCQIFRALSDEERNSLLKASFKLVKRNGQIVPLNYTQFDANADIASTGGIGAETPYYVAKEFQIRDQAEARKLAEAKAEPVPAGFYLMMGDNRNGSFDGRGWGLVPRDQIIGRSELIWLPLNRFGLTR